MLYWYGRLLLAFSLSPFTATQCHTVTTFIQDQYKSITFITIMATLLRPTRFTGLAIFMMIPDLLIAVLTMFAVLNTIDH